MSLGALIRLAGTIKTTIKSAATNTRGHASASRTPTSTMITEQKRGAMKHQWTALHSTTLEDIRERWANNPDGTVDPLNRDARWDKSRGVWRVTNALELHQLVGALHNRNPDLQLWFRGESKYFPSARPARYRPQPDSDGPSRATQLGREYLDRHAHRCRALRDRDKFARIAILQHYGCPTSFLDVSKSMDVATAFAFEKHAPWESSSEPHIRIYALPKHTRSITSFELADCILVDLESELPSYCLRPHVQRGGFIARTRGALYDLGQGTAPGEADYSLDGHCVAHIALHIKDGRKRFYEPRADLLYPRRTVASAAAKVPVNATGDGDYLLSLLRDISDNHESLKFRYNGEERTFPDNYSGDL